MTESLTNELLMRHVAVGHYDADAMEPAPGAFWPHKDHEGLLSTDRAEVWSPKKSYEHRTKVLNRESRGVVAMSTNELDELDLPSRPDPLDEDPTMPGSANPSHALVDFAEHIGSGRMDRRLMREALAALAIKQGWLHGPIVA